MFLCGTKCCPRTFSHYINSNYAAITVNCIRYLNIVLGFKWQHVEKAFGGKKKTCPVCIKCGIKLNERPDQKTSPELRSRTPHSLTPPPSPPSFSLPPTTARIGGARSTEPEPKAETEAEFETETKAIG